MFGMDRLPEGKGNSKGVVGEEGRWMVVRSAIDPFGWGVREGVGGRALSIGMWKLTRPDRDVEWEGGRC